MNRALVARLVRLLLVAGWTGVVWLLSGDRPRRAWWATGSGCCCRSSRRAWRPPGWSSPASRRPARPQAHPPPAHHAVLGARPDDGAGRRGLARGGAARPRAGPRRGHRRAARRGVAGRRRPAGREPPRSRRTACRRRSRTTSPCCSPGPTPTTWCPVLDGTRAAGRAGDREAGRPDHAGRPAAHAGRGRRRRPAAAQRAARRRAARARAPGRRAGRRSCASRGGG